ncbi:phosphatidylinositol phospholipase [Leptospira brenneri]|uniref:Uncharacterized protein n=1 Tax=Leptospira brenneri TaxID=2023182 RepID=A0A2M9XYF8_9LEPT|nr:hypothetical protein [Leptospira brenneri]PJZ44206.1 hypothetical protein CH361_16300 [Leptospira brenneri]TGK92872.1 hypothetical protein EHQ30_11600 [Leptospira brenneri]
MSQPKRVAFQKFLNAMRKLSTEVNDSEICKRLEILMATSKDDLPLAVVNQLLQDPKNFDPKTIPEPYTQYVRHFIYMVKRNGRVPSDLLAGEEDRSSADRASGSKPSAKKSASSKSKSGTSKSTTPVKKGKSSPKSSTKKA